MMLVVSQETLLFHHLMHGYNRDARPVKNASHAVQVLVGLTLTTIFDMDEKNQVFNTNVWIDQGWNDELLRWDPAEFGGIDSIRIPADHLWVPDIVLYNNADDFHKNRMPSKAMVEANGDVFWPIPTRLRSTCHTDVTFFPFDSQHCHMRFGSWAYPGFQVNVSELKSHVDLSNYVMTGEFDLISTHLMRRDVKYACCPESFPDVIFFFHIKRKFLFYVCNAVIPCVMLTLLCLLVFWLPPESGEKITLGVTVLLAFSVFMLNIAERMPETSDSLPLIGVYIILVKLMTCVSILMTVVVMNCHYQGYFHREVPEWLEELVLNKIRRLLRMDFSKRRTKGIKQSAKNFVRRRMTRRERKASLESSLVVNSPPLNLSVIAQSYQKSEREETRPNELFDYRLKWKRIAEVVDRLFFWIFLAIVSILSLLILVIIPLVRGRLDFTTDFDPTLYHIPSHAN